MSIVSKDLGSQFVFIKHNPRKGPVSLQSWLEKSEEYGPYYVNPSGELVQHHTRSFTKRCRFEDNYKPVGNNVPLKCLQTGSHAEGASLFYAPTPASTEPLKIQKEYSGMKLDHHETMVEEHVPHRPLDYNNLFNSGLRPSYRQSLASAVSEPSETEFRPEHFYKGNYKTRHPLGQVSDGPTVNYDVGFHGLYHA